MYRIRNILLIALAVCFALALTPAQAEVTLTPQAPGEATLPAITVTFSSETPGHLFLAGKPIELTAHIYNPFEAQDATVKIQILTVAGTVYAEKRENEPLPQNGTLDEKIIFGGNEDTVLPRGPYTVTVVVFGSEGKGGYGETHVGVWDGPIEVKAPFFGVNYLADLDGTQVATDLDLFKQAGAGWIRFPFQGWLPQGEKMPVPAVRYRNFSYAVTRRGMGVIAAFTPMVTVDPAVNPEKSVRDYTESLLSAASHCGTSIKTWELLRVPPAKYPPNLRGIDFTEIDKGRVALRGFDKSLQVVYPASDIRRDTMQLTTLMKLPAKEDAIGLQYSLIDIPESDRTSPRSPIYEIGAVRETARKALRRIPTIWATDYGFDADKGSRLSDVNQAALLARSIILNKAAGIERTLWRNNSESNGDLPLIARDGSAMPGLLAMRTIGQMMDGVTNIKPIAMNITGLRTFLVQYGPKTRKIAPRLGLIAWCDTGMDRTPMLIKTMAPQVKVTDLWGNVVDLFPMDNTVIFQVDGYPRFLDLGTQGIQEVSSARGIGGFENVAIRLDPINADHVNFAFHNDQMIFHGKLTGEVRCSAWPLTTEVTTSTFSLDDQSTSNTTIPIPLPADVQGGRILCEVSAQIFIGNRRMGYLTVPVYYSDKIQETW